jgi:hypothetical protein
MHYQDRVDVAATQDTLEMFVGAGTDIRIEPTPAMLRGILPRIAQCAFPCHDQCSNMTTS